LGWYPIMKKSSIPLFDGLYHCITRHYWLGKEKKLQFCSLADAARCLGSGRCSLPGSGRCWNSSVSYSSARWLTLLAAWALDAARCLALDAAGIPLFPWASSFKCSFPLNSALTQRLYSHPANHSNQWGGLSRSTGKHGDGVSKSGDGFFTSESVTSSDPASEHHASCISFPAPVVACPSSILHPLPMHLHHVREVRRRNRPTGREDCSRVSLLRIYIKRGEG